MPKKQPPPAQHTLDVYGHTIHRAYSKAHLKRINKTRFSGHMTKDETRGDCAGQTITLDHCATNGWRTPHVVIFINTPTHTHSQLELADTIAHEATHAAETILKDRSIEPTGEPLAYLVGWLTRHIWEGVPNSPLT